MYNPNNTLNSLICINIQTRAKNKIDSHKRSGTLNDGQPFENLPILQRCKARKKAGNLFDLPEKSKTFVPYRTQPTPLQKDKLYSTEYIDVVTPAGNKKVMVIEQRGKRSLLQAYFHGDERNKVIASTVKECYNLLLTA